MCFLVWRRRVMSRDDDISLASSSLWRQTRLGYKDIIYNTCWKCSLKFYLFFFSMLFIFFLFEAGSWNTCVKTMMELSTNYLVFLRRDTLWIFGKELLKATKTKVFHQDFLPIISSLMLYKAIECSRKIYIILVPFIYKWYKVL